MKNEDTVCVVCGTRPTPEDDVLCERCRDENLDAEQRIRCDYEEVEA